MTDSQKRDFTEIVKVILNSLEKFSDKNYRLKNYASIRYMITQYNNRYEMPITRHYTTHLEDFIKNHEDILKNFNISVSPDTTIAAFMYNGKLVIVSNL